VLGRRIGVGSISCIEDTAGGHNMKLSRAASILLVAITLLAVGALGGQLRQPAPAGAADNSAAILAQLKILNDKIGQQYNPDTLIGEAHSTQKSILTLRNDVGEVCEAIASLPDAAHSCPISP
jgi:hypothetical protein